MKHKTWKFRGSFTAMFLCLAAVTFYAISGVQAATSGPVQNVSNDGPNPGSILPKVAQDPQGNVHVVWDSQEGARTIRYAKGTWNGSEWSFGGSTVLGSVGGFGYSTPNVGVSRNGRVLVAWGEPGRMNIR